MKKDLFPHEDWIKDAFDFDKSGSFEYHEEMHAANTFAKMAEAKTLEEQQEIFEASLRGEDVCNPKTDNSQESYSGKQETKESDKFFYMALLGGLLLPVGVYEAIGINGAIPLLLDLLIRLLVGIGIWKILKKPFVS